MKRRDFFTQIASAAALGTSANTPLVQGEQLVLFPSARAAVRLIETHTGAPGDLLRLLIGSFGELLAFQKSLAIESNRERLDVMRSLLELYDTTSRLAIVRTIQLVGSLSPQQVAESEARLRASLLFHELVAFEVFLSVPIDESALPDNETIPEFRFQVARMALARIGQGNLQKGELSKLLVLSLDELLQSADLLARAVYAKHLQAVIPLLGVLRLASSRLKQGGFAIIDQLPAADLEAVEEFLRTGLIFRETIAFEPLLNAPHFLVPVQDKQDDEEILAATKKAEIKKLLEKVLVVGGFLTDLLDIIDEILELLKGGADKQDKAEKATDSIKEIIKKLLPGSLLKSVLESFLGVIDELLKLLKGRRRGT